MALIFYARVSSPDQNLNRQLVQAKKVKADKIFIEKYSGKSMNRPAMNKMKKYLREGDTLEVSSLDRISRNFHDLQAFVQWLQRNNILLKVYNLPSFSSDNKLLNDFSMTMIVDIMGFVADNERHAIRERQKQGIAIARKAGKYKGRVIKYGPNSKHPQYRIIWQKVIDMLSQPDKYTIKGIARTVGLSRSQVYRIKHRYEASKKQANTGQKASAHV